MKIRYVRSATVVIEHNGIKVLCDPWLTEGIYYGSWFSFPVNKFTAQDFQDVDYIYISHIHPDHCDEATLKDLPKHIPVLILDFEEKFLFRTLKRLGFENVVEIPNRGEYELGKDFKIEIMAADDCNASRFCRIYGIDRIKDYDKTLQIDSLAIFSGGGKVVLNTNDVPYSMFIDSAGYILSKYEKIDFLLVSYAGAGPFPQCYMMTPDTMLQAAAGAAYAFVSGTIGYIQYLRPKYFMPYAGQYTLGGKLSWMNAYKGTIELDELFVDLVPFLRSHNLVGDMVALDAGEYFDLETEQASKAFTPTNFLERKKYIANVLSKKKYDYELMPSTFDDFTEQFKQAREVLWRKQQMYGYFANYNVFVNVGYGEFYKINLSNKDIIRTSKESYETNCFLATLDSRLMRMILERKANWNNAEIGSHITLYDFIPKIVQQRTYEPMPHFLMSYFQMPVQKAVSQEKVMSEA